MATAPNRMTRRLSITIASYLELHGDWPTEARLSAEAMYSIANTLDPEHFQHLADKLKLRVTKHSEIAVGGAAGHVVYPPTEVPNAAFIDRVEGEIGFDEVIFDPPSDTLVNLTAALFGQEVFHQLVLRELLATTDLGQQIGIWHNLQPPAVTYEPRRGLFDLGLAQFTGGVKRPIEVYLEIKVGSYLGADQFRRQQAGADGLPTAYVLLGPTYFGWQHVPTATFVGLTELAESVNAIGASHGGGTGELARVYGARLSQEAERWSTPLILDRDWDGLDYFRFYAEIGPTWPVPVNIYPVTNRSGQQYVLNTPTAWAAPPISGWDGAQVYWELIDGRLRYKVTSDGSVEGRRRLREVWRRAPVRRPTSWERFSRNPEAHLGGR